MISTTIWTDSQVTIPYFSRSGWWCVFIIFQNHHSFIDFLTLKTGGEEEQEEEDCDESLT